MRVLRVASACQTALDLGPTPASPQVAVAVVVERGWWRLPEANRAEVIALLARLIARGVLVEDPPAAAPLTAGSASVGAGGAG